MTLPEVLQRFWSERTSVQCIGAEGRGISKECPTTQHFMQPSFTHSIEMLYLWSLILPSFSLSGYADIFSIFWEGIQGFEVSSISRMCE